MKAALLSQGSKSSQMTLEALKKYFDSVESINIKNLEVMMGSRGLRILYEGKPLNDFDCMYAKGSFRYAPLLRSIATAYYDNAYMPIKPNAFTLGHDKLLTHLALQQNKIPMPDTFIVSSIEAAKKILEQVHYPIVMKFPQGTQGKGVLFADSFASASSILDAMETFRNPFLIQEFIETGGTDLRAFVIGDKVVAAMRRKAVVGEQRANIHAGASGEPVIVDTHTKRIALNAARAIGAEICAIDMLESVKGPQVLEINLSPGLQGITTVTEIDVADKIAKFMLEKTQQYVEKGKTTKTDKMLSSLGVDSGNGTEQQIVSNLDFRSDRILLPKIATQLSRLDESSEVVIKASKGKVVVEKF